MKKRVKVFTSLCTITCILGTVTGCNLSFDKESSTPVVEEVSPYTYHTISFDTNGGNEMASIRLYSSQTLSTPANPHRDGYVFAGWYLNYNCTIPFDINEPIQSDITLYASWSNKAYTMHFVTNSNAVYEDMKVNENTPIAKPKDPMKRGYVFTGWYLDEDLTLEFDFSSGIQTDVTLYGAWEPLSNKIHFVTNSDTVIEDQKVYSNELPVEPEEPTLEGYEFAGWYIDRYCTIEFNFQEYIDTNITLYAKWALKTYNLVFISDGDVFYENTRATNVPEASLIPTKDEYTFMGWYYDEDYKYIASPGDALTEDTTLYAKWECFTFTISSNNDNYGNIATSIGFKETEGLYISNGYVRGIGTATETTIYINHPIRNFAFENNSTIEKVILGPGVTDIGYRAFYYCSNLMSVEFVGDIPEIGSDIFAGAWDNSNFRVYVPEAFYSNYYNSQKDYWFHLRLAEEGRLEILSSDSLLYGNITEKKITANDTITLIATPKLGNSFAGWWCNGECISYESIYTFPMRMENLFIEARFEEITYTVNYYDDNAMIHSQAGLTHLPDQFPILDKDSYVFMGWYRDNYSDNEAIPGEKIYQDTTLYARWVQKVIPTVDCYTIENDYAVLSSCPSVDRGYVIIPEEVTIDGITYIVKKIGSSALQYSSNYYVELPNTIESIESYAFYNSQIKEISIPDSVKEIHYNAFTYCYMLRTVTLGANVEKIYDGAFAGCDRLAVINLPSSVNYIGYAFGDCYCDILCEAAEANGNYDSNWYGTATPIWDVKDFIKVKTTSGKYYINPKTKEATLYQFLGDSNTIIPDSIFVNGEEYYVTTIGVAAFVNKSLDSLQLPEHIKTIENSSFRDCNIYSLYIPKSVECIADNAFRYSYISSVEVDENNLYYSMENGVLFNKDKTELIKCFQQSGVESYTIPDTVITIKPYAFYNSNLKELIFSDSVKTIEEWACSNMYNLSTLTLGSVEEIERYAFSSNYQLKNIEIPNTVKSIGEYAFAWNQSLQIAYIPASVEEIQQGAFTDCSGVILCEAEAALPNWNSWWAGESNVIWGASNVEVVTYDDFKFILESSTMTAIISSYVGPNTVIQIPSEVSHLGNTYSITDIPKRLFNGNYSIQEIYISEGISTIGEYAFSNSSLQRVHIPQTVTSIGYWAFGDCSRLESIEVDTNNTTYSSIDGVLFNMNGTELILYPRNLTASSYSVPNTVVTIKEYAFIGTNNLSEIIFPDSLATIESTAFQNSSIETITFGNGLKEIDNYVFSSCYNLKEVDLSDSLERIGYYAFAWNSNLKTINIPSSVTYIGSYAFDGDNNLSIYCEATEKPNGWNYYWDNGVSNIYWNSTSH